MSTAVDAKGVGDRIRSLARKHKLTVEDFANRVGLSRSGAQRFLSGEGTPSLEVVCKALSFEDVTADWLLTGQERAGGAPSSGSADLDGKLRNPLLAASFLSEQEKLLARNRERMLLDAKAITDQQNRLHEIQSAVHKASEDLRRVNGQHMQVLAAMHKASVQTCVQAMASSEQIFLDVIFELGLVESPLSSDRALEDLLRAELGNEDFEQFKGVLERPSRHRDGYRGYLAHNQAGIDLCLVALQSEGFGFDAMDAVLRSWAVFQKRGIPWYMIDQRYKWENVKKAAPGEAA